MTVSDTKELKAFLAGYFHQDWELDASEPDDVIDQFLRGGPAPAEIERLIAQIRRYLDAAGDDSNIEQDLFAKFGCYYLPSADGWSARDWLRHLLIKFEADRSPDA